uniref:Uncharacterized protein n=1 Tax=Anguilla anguilla TaxID=7936 RepID=A0A0E9QA47_ANGAN
MGDLFLFYERFITIISFLMYQKN